MPLAPTRPWFRHHPVRPWREQKFTNSKCLRSINQLYQSSTTSKWEKVSRRDAGHMPQLAWVRNGIIHSSIAFMIYPDTLIWCVWKLYEDTNYFVGQRMIWREKSGVNHLIDQTMIWWGKGVILMSKTSANIWIMSFKKELGNTVISFVLCFFKWNYFTI